MSLTSPDVGGSDGNLQEKYPEGQPFMLVGVENVTANTRYGEGTMTILTIRDEDGQERRYSVWGAYIAAQVESVESGDLNKPYRVTRGPVQGFSDRPDTKRLTPAEEVPF